MNYPTGYGKCLRCDGPLRYCPDAVTDGWDDTPAIPAAGDRVEAWRLHVLLEAGYPLELAEQLATAAHVDLHVAAELVTARGCRHETAAAILL